MPPVSYRTDAAAVLPATTANYAFVQQRNFEIDATSKTATSDTSDYRPLCFDFGAQGTSVNIPLIEPQDQSLQARALSGDFGRPLRAEPSPAPPSVSVGDTLGTSGLQYPSGKGGVANPQPLPAFLDISGIACNPPDSRPPDSGTFEEWPQDCD
ncbi:hypothetical protein HPB52_007842 [Rhipicephalus sanguineus]|uniref:Uncharacterized protein n=1 Tax=Rhipicephalus sanguineus TaxID=34632 RepID=A0A9D4QAD8_RHISA|nr:hypothetical protein HPB52_007842 [Rhipicephalus sanguineus]